MSSSACFSTSLIVTASGVPLTAVFFLKQCLLQIQLNIEEGNQLKQENNFANFEYSPCAESKCQYKHSYCQYAKHRACNYIKVVV